MTCNSFRSLLYIHIQVKTHSKKETTPPHIHTVRERERARLGFEGQCPPNTDKKVLKIISLPFPYYMMLYIQLLS